MFTIRCSVLIRAPVARCFDLARSVDLHADSSPEIGARAVGGRRTGLSGPDDWTVWSARFFGLRFRLTAQIQDFSRPARFSDHQTRGLLRAFSHVYRCDPQPGGTCFLSDELTVSAPLGYLGRALEILYLRRRMHTLVRRRLERIKAVAEDRTRWGRYLAEAISPDRSS